MSVLSKPKSSLALRQEEEILRVGRGRTEAIS